MEISKNLSYEEHIFMSRKQYSKELKLELVKKHLEDGISYWKLGKEYGIEASIIRRWGHKYEIFGEDGLEKQNADLCNYSAEFKKKIVLEYLGGNITSQDLAAKYKIHAPSTVRTWIKQYNNHEDLTNSRKEGVYLMAKNGARKNTTLEERINIVEECINTGCNYASTANKYGCSYGQVYAWVRKYKDKGIEGLYDRRGKNKAISQLSDIEKLKAENRLLKAQTQQQQMEIDFLKTRQNREEGNLIKTRNSTKYLAIKELSDENKTYSILALCEFAGIARSAYYKWLGHVNSDNDNLNERIADTITKIHDEHPDMGYRRIRDTLAHDYKIAVNDKRVLRICRKKKIQSYIKHRYNCCTKPASDPAYVAENILNREFKSDMINQKWVTDVSEFKYGVGEDDKKGKLYLSVILDLCDRRPVAFVYSTRNDNPLVFDTFDKAVAANPGATPLLHSDRGYQYTSKAFRRRILAAGMTQSMSRVARCIDNGPMEGFWGLMKREMYYGKKYKTKEELMLAIEKYIDYYTNKRVQRNLGVLTPLEFHEQKLKNVA